MADRISTFTIAFDGDAGAFQKTIGSLKASLTQTVRDLETLTNKADLFAKTEESAKAAAESFKKTTDAAALLKTQIDKINASGGKVGDDLAKQFTAASKAADTAGKVYDKQVTTVAKLQKVLAAAGFDTANFAKSQADLAKQTALASAALTLNLKSAQTIAPELAKAAAAFNTLKTQGGLSFGELSGAAAALKTKQDELKGSTLTLGSAFSSIKTEIIALGASFAVVGVAIKDSIQAAREFSNAMGALKSIAGASQSTLDALAQGARDVALEFGGNAVEGVKALRDIISQGIPADNALSVLQASAAAAEASFTDLGTTARLSTTLINAFGISATDLSGQLDKIFAAAKDGGASLGDLAGSLGELGPLSKSAGIPLGDLVASIQTLRKAGLDTPTAIMALNKIITAFSAPTEAAALRAHELGVEFNGLVGTIKSIGEKGLSVDQLKAIIPDARSIKAVAALTTNFQGLTAEIAKLDGAAGVIKQTADALQNTPEQKIKQFDAAVKDLGISIGTFVGEGAKLLSALTEIINAFNKLPTSTKETAFEITALVGGFAALYIAIRTLQIPINILASVLPGIKSGFGGLIAGIDAASLAMRGLGVAAAALIGFKVGEWARDNVTQVRIFGDVIGTLAGGLLNQAGPAFQALTALLTSNKAAFDEAGKAAAANGRQFQVDLINAYTGASAALDQLTAKQRDLQTQLQATTDAAAKASQGLSGAIATLANSVGTQIAAVATKIGTITATMQGLVAGITAAAAASQAASAQAITNINTDAAARIAALDQSSAKELETATARLEIENKAATDRLAVLNKSSVDTLAILNTEADARRAIAQRTGEDAKKVEADILSTKQSALQKIVDQYRTHIAGLEALDQAHLAKIQALEKQRQDLDAGSEDKIRAIRQQGLDAYSAYQDKVRQIDELLSKARIALTQDDVANAETLAKRAEALVGGISQEVKDGQNTVIAGYEAQGKAISALEDVNSVLNGVITKRQDAEKTGADQTSAQLHDASLELSAYQAQLESVTNLAKNAIVQKISLDTTDIDAGLVELDKKLAEKVFLIDVKANLDDVLAQANELAANIAKGITDGTTPALDDLKLKLEAIAVSAPELKLDTTAAEKAIAAVQSSVKALEDVKLKITSNADDITKQLDVMAKDRTLNLEVKVKVTGDKIPGGGTVNTGGVAAGDPGATGFSRGGLAQRFARGGSVFGGRKVPGTGNLDTFSANLQGGSFVLKKAASEYYGDNLLSKLARGAVQKFALGGFSFPLTWQNLLSTKLPDGVTIGINSGASSPAAISDLQDTQDKLEQISSAALNLPPSHNLPDVREWAAALMERVVSLSAEKLALVRKIIDDNLQGILSGIDIARQFRVPAAVGPDLFALLYGRGGGTPTTDTVPALLTPGEWVVKPSAVSRVGSGFMHALNNMQIPREALARMIEPPRVHRFADGGPVPGLTSSSMVAAVRERSTTTNIRVSGEGISEWFTESNVRRYVKPILENLNRRSR